MSPFWFYSAGSLTGLVNWVAVALSSLSDVMQPKWRAPSFGLLLAGFSLGLALAPQLALLFGHWFVSLLALASVWLGLVVTVFFLPETVSPEMAVRASVVREEMSQGLKGAQRILWNLYRPMWELSILNRSRLFRLLSILAFFSGMVSSGDHTLLIYYIEEMVSCFRASPASLNRIDVVSQHFFPLAAGFQRHGYRRPVLDRGFPGYLCAGCRFEVLERCNRRASCCYT
jgi:hypothetical protein